MPFAPDASLPGTIFHPLPVCHSHSSPFFSPACMLARPRSRAARLKIRGREPALGQTHHGIQTDGIRRDRAPDPRQRRRLGARVELEDLDRFPGAVVDDVQGVKRVPARTQRQAVRSESFLFLGIDRAGARIVGLGVQTLLRRRGREQRGRRLVADVDQCDRAAGRIPGRNHPLGPGDDDEIFGTDDPTDELDIPQGVASGRCRSRRFPAASRTRPTTQAASVVSSHSSGGNHMPTPPGRVEERT